MTEHWVDITADGATVRYPLRTGLTRLGGAGADVLVPGAPDELHIWSDPPKAIHVGSASVPLVAGRAFEESVLADGDTIQWGAAVLVYGRTGQALVEELPMQVTTSSPPAGGLPVASRVGTVAPVAARPMPSTGSPGLFEKRLHAGVLADLGLVSGKAVRRWQDAVRRGEFDADACARELVIPSAPGPDDQRLLERASRLQRDLLMMPVQRGVRGAGRRARVATRRGTAIVLANIIAITVYSFVLVAIMILVRRNYNFSFDGLIDQFLGIF